jgi:hypothetical protein
MQNQGSVIAKLDPPHILKIAKLDLPQICNFPRFAKSLDQALHKNLENTPQINQGNSKDFNM